MGDHSAETDESPEQTGAQEDAVWEGSGRDRPRCDQGEARRDHGHADQEDDGPQQQHRKSQAAASVLSGGQPWRGDRGSAAGGYHHCHLRGTQRSLVYEG